MNASIGRSSLILFLLAQCCHAGVLRVPEQHASIQAAIDVAAPGDVVMVSAGTYRERLRLARGVTLRSAGNDEKGKHGLKRAEATIIDGSDVKGAAPGIMMAEGATLDGFTVTGVGRYDDALWQKHHATRGEQQPHEHIGHFGTPGIGIVGANCTVARNVVHHNGGTGIGIRGTKSSRCMPLISENVCYRNMGGGIGSMQGSAAIIDNNVCFQNYYAGIGHDGAHPVVTRNRCFENVRAGIGVSENAKPVVRNNKCYRNRRAGIGIRTGSATTPVIEDNDCYENGMAGIGCEEQSRPIVRGNRCYRNAMAGIGAQKGARPTIVDNLCYENKAAGIGIRDGAQAVIVRNESRENHRAGIGVRSGAKAVVCHNRCIENKLVALGLPDGASAVVHGNEFVRSGGGPPLIAIKGGATTILSSNKIRGGGVAGVLLQGKALFADNQFQGKGAGQGTAIWVWAKSEAVVHQNQFDGYRHAVNAAQAKVVVDSNTIRGFQKHAIVVKQASAPAHVFGNTAVSAKATDKALLVEGPRGVIDANNRIEK